MKTLTKTIILMTIIAVLSCKKKEPQSKTPEEQVPTPTLSFDTTTTAFPIKIGGGGNGIQLVLRVMWRNEQGVNFQTYDGSQNLLNFKYESAIGLGSDVCKLKEPKQIRLTLRKPGTNIFEFFQKNPSTNKETKCVTLEFRLDTKLNTKIDMFYYDNKTVNAALCNDTLAIMY